MHFSCTPSSQRAVYVMESYEIESSSPIVIRILLQQSWVSVRHPLNLCYTYLMLQEVCRN